MILNLIILSIYVILNPENTSNQLRIVYGELDLVTVVLTQKLIVKGCMKYNCLKGNWLNRDGSVA